ncbi:MAG: dihydrofolate reductase [Myxococcota bacterium]|nr:dihydrofolate reductase [Myxococcota bacterium]
MKPLSMIVAMNPQRVIGANGDLPWKIREDLRHFRKVTMGHPIIMGRRTWDSIGRPLPGRHNIVVTRNPKLALDGVTVVHSLEEALAVASSEPKEPMIIGGATLYALALPMTTRLFLTMVQREVEGDTFFPVFSDADWIEVERRAGKTEGVDFITLQRKKMD